MKALILKDPGDLNRIKNEPDIIKKIMQCNAELENLRCGSPRVNNRIKEELGLLAQTAQEYGSLHFFTSEVISKAWRVLGDVIQKCWGNFTIAQKIEILDNVLLVLKNIDFCVDFPPPKPEDFPCGFFKKVLTLFADASNKTNKELCCKLLTVHSILVNTLPYNCIEHLVETLGKKGDLLCKTPMVYTSLFNIDDLNCLFNSHYIIITEKYCKKNYCNVIEEIIIEIIRKHYSNKTRKNILSQFQKLMRNSLSTNKQEIICATYNSLINILGRTNHMEVILDETISPWVIMAINSNCQDPKSLLESLQKLANTHENELIKFMLQNEFLKTLTQIIRSLKSERLQDREELRILIDGPIEELISLLSEAGYQKELEDAGVFNALVELFKSSKYGYEIKESVESVLVNSCGWSHVSKVESGGSVGGSWAKSGLMPTELIILLGVKEGRIGEMIGLLTKRVKRGHVNEVGTRENCKKLVEIIEKRRIYHLDVETLMSIIALFIDLVDGGAADTVVYSGILSAIVEIIRGHEDKELSKKSARLVAELSVWGYGGEVSGSGAVPLIIGMARKSGYDEEYLSIIGTLASNNAEDIVKAGAVKDLVQRLRVCMEDPQNNGKCIESVIWAILVLTENSVAAVNELNEENAVKLLKSLEEYEGTMTIHYVPSGEREYIKVGTLVSEIIDALKNSLNDGD